MISSLKKGLRSYIRTKVQKLIANQETGYMLNTLTLQIRNSEVTQNCEQHQARKFDTFLNACIVIGVCVLILSSTTAFGTKTGHAVAVLNNALCLFFILVFKLYRYLTKSTKHRDYLMVSIMIVPVVLSILVNTGNLP